MFYVLFALISDRILDVFEWLVNVIQQPLKKLLSQSYLPLHCKKSATPCNKRMQKNFSVFSLDFCQNFSSLICFAFVYLTLHEDQYWLKFLKPYKYFCMKFMWVCFQFFLPACKFQVRVCWCENAAGNISENSLWAWFSQPEQTWGIY